MVNSCAVLGADPLPIVLHPWKWPREPWSRIHKYVCNFIMWITTVWQNVYHHY